MARTYDSSRRAEAAHQTRETILSAAFRLHGLGIIDLETLAREANVSVATIRKHFPTREHLFEGCTSYGLHVVSPPDMARIEAAPDLESRVQVVVEEVYAVHEALFGQMWSAFKLEDQSPVMARILDEMQTVLGIVADSVMQLRDEAPNAAADRGFVIGFLSPLSYRALRQHGGLSPDEAIAHASRALLHALEGTPQQEAAHR